MNVLGGSAPWRAWKFWLSLDHHRARVEDSYPMHRLLLRRCDPPRVGGIDYRASHHACVVFYPCRCRSWLCGPLMAVYGMVEGHRVVLVRTRHRLLAAVAVQGYCRPRRTQTPVVASTHAQADHPHRRRRASPGRRALHHLAANPGTPAHRVLARRCAADGRRRRRSYSAVKAVPTPCPQFAYKTA
jgi:hypothetical protein